MTAVRKYSAFAVVSLLALVPFFAFAQRGRREDDTLGEIGSTFLEFQDFINDILIPLVFAVALLVFLWGIFKYFILGGGDEGKRAEGRQLMLYSILGFGLMVAIFALVNLLVSGLGLDDENDTLDIPEVPTR